MASSYYVKSGPNRLLRGLVVISLGIHFLLFLHISGLYKSRALQFIDLTLRDMKKPMSRGIPRPPMIPKEQEKPNKEKVYQMRPIQMPDISKDIFDSGTVGLSSNLMEGVAGISSGVDYKEMVLLRIERAKKYPKDAEGKYQEGVVSLSFVINPDGTIRDLKIIKPSPYRSLNQAALQAVRDSVPFPKPPPGVFKGGVEILPNITFEKI